MPPPDSGASEARGARGARRAAERALRLTSLLALLALLALALRDLRAPARGRVVRADGARALRAALGRASRGAAPARVEARLDLAPGPEARDWMAALRAAGTSVAWRDDGLAATAVAVEPIADPARPARLLVAAPAGRRVALEDALGPVDTVTAAGGGAAVVVPRVEGLARARVGRDEATAAARDSLVLRRVLVLGVAGWEAKFAVAALAERGWVVDARLAVSPAGDAVQGAPTTPDTARYAAVVALDTSAGRWAEGLRAYVRSGGGLVVAGDGARAAGLATVLPAAPAGASSAPGDLAADSADPRAALARVSLGRPAPGAVALEARAGAPAVLARRVGGGRVVQSAYLDTWRWRLGGPEPDPAAQHRAWWAGLVGAAAYAPAVPLAATFSDPTPYASLVKRLGPPSTADSSGAADQDVPAWLRPLLFGLLLGTLLAEWASRRLRGSR